jgi:hypothetical protein
MIAMITFLFMSGLHHLTVNHEAAYDGNLRQWKDPRCIAAI